MPCVTCGHTMEGIGHGMFHCPRCGTLINRVSDYASVPALVGRCLSFKAAGLTDAQNLTWRQLGIEEATKMPAHRES